MSRTLADMTPAERDACVGMWAEVRRHLVIVAEIYERDGDAYVFRPETQNINWYLLQDLTPRLDLRRAWTAEGEPAPLPEPDRDGRWWPTAASIGSVTISPAGEVVLHSGRFRDMRLYLTPEKATDLADILKAAAARAEGVGRADA